jgi:hypothetical protein
LFESQQPEVQCAGSHGVTPASQPLPKHVRPEPHAVPPLHVHAPPVQPFATPVQLEHVAPPVPHAPAVSPVWHTPFKQQPLGHDAGSQMHEELPPSLAQRVPAAHRPPAPQWQEPPLQLSPPSHAVHVAPAVPHWFALTAVTQTLPEQQPEHVVGSHVQLPPEHL